VPFEEGMVLNMGQLLSIPFVLLGIFILFYYYHKEKKAKTSEIVS
jgi:phosphatidylglycerol:prolipoprotein diacylglycerol transferase